MKIIGFLAGFLGGIMIWTQQLVIFTPPESFELVSTSPDEIVYKSSSAGAVFQLKEIPGLNAQKAIEGFSTSQLTKNSLNLIESVPLKFNEEGFLGNAYVSQFYLEGDQPQEIIRILAIAGKNNFTCYISVTMPSLSYKMLKETVFNSIQSLRSK
ncbi:MAG: hypothetical protein N2Z72_05340 [Bacteroidales bacterium]|nr:hypothetical protein [Bacteroidales bacterium]